MKTLFKVVTDQNKRLSLVVYKGVDNLLEALVSVLEAAFPNIRITSYPTHYFITGMSDTAMFSAIKTFIEEYYLKL